LVTLRDDHRSRQEHPSQIVDAPQVATFYRFWDEF